MLRKDLDPEIGYDLIATFGGIEQLCGEHGTPKGDRQCQQQCDYAYR